MSQLDPSKIVVLVPVFGNPRYKTMRAVEDTGFNQLVAYDDPWICRVRCYLAQEALDRGFEWFVWIDHDMDFQPGQVHELVRQAIAHDVKVLAGVYAKKAFGQGLTCVFEASQGERVRMGDLSQAPRKAKLMPMGFTATHRSAFEAIRDSGGAERFRSQGGWAYGWFLHRISACETFMGEDHSFQSRCEDAGIDCYIHPGVLVGHCGGYTYTPRDGLSGCDELALSEQQVDPKEPGGET
jgi:hypothetical protein